MDSCLSDQSQACCVRCCAGSQGHKEGYPVPKLAPNQFTRAMCVHLFPIPCSVTLLVILKWAVVGNLHGGMSKCYKSLLFPIPQPVLKYLPGHHYLKDSCFSLLLLLPLPSLEHSLSTKLAPEGKGGFLSFLCSPHKKNSSFLEN